MSNPSLTRARAHVRLFLFLFLYLNSLSNHPSISPNAFVPGDGARFLC